jgi:hypothetical protein
VGLGSVPPAYPEVIFTIPGTYWKTASRHQKHPPPNVAMAVLAGDGEGLVSAGIGVVRVKENRAERSKKVLMASLSSTCRKIPEERADGEGATSHRAVP